MQIDFGTRRVQYIGQSCFISLPRAWARTQGIEKGTRICIGLLDDGSLRICKNNECGL